MTNTNDSDSAPEMEAVSAENNTDAVSEVETSQPAALDTANSIVDDTQRVINLGCSLEIREAQELLGDFQEALNSENSIRLDSGELEKTDTAGLQILVAFIKDAETKKLGVEWVGVSDCLRQSAAQVGLTSALNI